MMLTRRKLALAAIGMGSLLAMSIAAAVPLSLRYARAHPDAARALRARLAGAHYLGTAGVVLQQRLYDCGAASLKMVLHTRGIERELGELEAAARTTRRGATLLNLRMAAEAHGVAGRAWALTPDDLARAPMPVIAFVGGDHYVVVRSVGTDGVLVVDDPAIGKLRWPIRAFRRKWSGETLVFDPLWTPPIRS